MRDNLSETLFKPKLNQAETSTLVERYSLAGTEVINPALEGESQTNWYRVINPVLWNWRGINPVDLEQVLSRIAASSAPRSKEHLLDTVIGYRSGNWVYEWTCQGMVWQQQALSSTDALTAGHHWLMAANHYCLASYPHLRGDRLAEQAEALANRAYEEAAKLLPYEMKVLDIAVANSSVKALLYLPDGQKGPHPTVVICTGLDNLQSDYHRLFHDYFSPAGVAMLCLDLPSTGFSSSWLLTEDTSFLHQQLIAALPSIPWIDHQRVALLGFRFGANVAVRLAYLDVKRLRAVACVGPIVHQLLSNVALQNKIPSMYKDLMASRLGMNRITNEALSLELKRYSLKTQGLLGRNCSVPMLSASLKHDLFSPLEDSMLIVNSSSKGQLLSIADKPAHESFYRGLKEVCTWLIQQLH